MSNIKHQIITWKNALLSPNKNDVLLNLIDQKNACNILSVYHSENKFKVEEDALIANVYKQHLKHIKETGSPIFGIASDLLLFSFEGIDYRTPFLLASADITKNRFNPFFEIQQTEDFYINPLVLNLLGLKELPTEIEEALTLLSSLGLKVNSEKGVWMANFHPHRFVLQKELDGLVNAKNLSNSLKRLFGESSDKQKLDLSPHYLFSADESQREAIQKVKVEDLVLQGPPGTGKSQVIANLIGQTIGRNQKALLVAEKAVALQVIYDQMMKKNLHYFCVLYHHELKSKYFVQSLLETWKYIEQLPAKPIVLNQQSKFLLQGLDLTLSRLKQKDLIGGLSLTEFKNEFIINEKTKYLSEIPEIPVWKKDKETLKNLIRNDFDVYGPWLKLKTEKHSIKDLDAALEKTLLLLKKTPNQESNYKDFKRNIQLSGLASLFFYQDIPLPIEVFQTESKLQKRFQTLYNTFKTLSEKEGLLKKEEQHWSKEFSLSELEEYILALGSINRFNIRSQLTKRKLSKFTDLNLTDGKKALENLVELNTVKKDIIEVKDKLRKQKLPDELSVLNYINYTISKINTEDQNNVQYLFELTNKERINLKNASPNLRELNSTFHEYFVLNEEESIVKQLRDVQHIIPLLVENSMLLEKIDSKTKFALLQTNSIEETESAIYNSHYKNFKGQYPSLAELTGKEIEVRVENIIHALAKESDEYSEYIQQKIKKKFEDYNTLLQVPARKLSDEEKLLKQNLRKGKSILVKAFDRKRVFPTVRELLESEAKYWIEILKPVFLCSPYSVAKSLPLDFTFDLGVFDEASQIPISHIVGSVQRAKRIVISGDQQQMAPQFYFQKKDAHQTDALHHASFYLENALLTHHYRSNHPQLIAFSNQYFYENKLKTFPTVNTQFPIEVIDADGIFEDRINKKEAEVCADLIIKKIENKEFNFGLVSFSQAQLNAILGKIPAALLSQLEDKKSIFIQSLENVQGDQCEHLIISLGYAKNPEGEFHKRFGPLNQDQGHRRLNVLMSRAQSKITFIRSISSEDFSISSNDGLEMLRKLMLFLEQEAKPMEEVEFQSGIMHSGNKIRINDLASAFSSEQELLDFYRTSLNRGWKLEIEI